MPVRVGKLREPVLILATSTATPLLFIVRRPDVEAHTILNLIQALSSMGSSRRAVKKLGRGAGGRVIGRSPCKSARGMGDEATVADQIDTLPVLFAGRN